MSPTDGSGPTELAAATGRGALGPLALWRACLSFNLNMVPHTGGNPPIITTATRGVRRGTRGGNKCRGGLDSSGGRGCDKHMRPLRGPWAPGTGARGFGSYIVLRVRPDGTSGQGANGQVPAARSGAEVVGSPSRRSGNTVVMEIPDLARAIKELHEWALTHAPAPEPPVRQRLREHLGTDPVDLEVVTETLASYDRPNLQVALDAYEHETDDEMSVMGLTTSEHGMRAGLAALARVAAGGVTVTPGPVEHVRVNVGDRVITSVDYALLLFHDDESGPIAALVTSAEGQWAEGLRLEVMSSSRTTAERWLARVRELMREHNVFRGKVVAFGGAEIFDETPLTVRQLPDIQRDAIVLPAGTLERIERHTIELAERHDLLRQYGQHIKRGVLLHGPPGTGKTLTVMHLASRMAGRTVVLLTGEAMAFITAGVQLARSLEPAMVVVEDVDLVAMDREEYATNPVLFELLNAMDGLDTDADIIFVLTTNRPQVLEPALAARPGRIDLAVGLPLPDARARQALLALFSRTLPSEPGTWGPIVEATDGASPAFIRELVRRATLLAAERDAAHPSMTGDVLQLALSELQHGGELTARLLGADQSSGDATDTNDPLDEDVNEDEQDY